MSLPETRASLILRLPNSADVEAWDEFVAIYEPVVYRLIRGRGLQDADARELVQDVLLAVSQAVERWDPDPRRGRFRDWLSRIARNRTINFLTRRRDQPLGTGDSAMVGRLAEIPVESSAECAARFDLEHRREMFRRAADLVRSEVRPRTWRAFWMTAIEGRAVAKVAAELQMSVGSVYIARSRVMGRLRGAVSQMQSEWGGGESS